MQARRFRASTLADAYERVRETFGEDAIILSTRTGRGPGVLGVGRREYVEIVAGLPEAADGRTVPLAEDAAAHEFVRAVADTTAREGGVATDARIAVDAAHGSEGEPDTDEELAPPFANPLAGSGQTTEGTTPAEPVADPDMLTSIAAQIEDMRLMVQRVALERVNERIDGGPPALRAVRARLASQEVGADLLIRVLDRVATALTEDAGEEAAVQLVQRRLAAELLPAVTLDTSRPPQVVFLVGPSGGGKTTLAVRLGLQLVAGQGLAVTVAGTDVDRVGAPQELQAYGAATGLPVRLCYTPGELQTLVREGDADVVIVDTAGHSGGRRERMAELQAFMRAVTPHVALLALPATMRSSDAGRAAAAFATLGLDGLAITRCDETSTLGGLLSTAVTQRLGVAYTTHGASVRDAARSANNHVLAGAVMLGSWSATRAAAATAGAGVAVRAR